MNLRRKSELEAALVVIKSEMDASGGCYEPGLDHALAALEWALKLRSDWRVETLQ